MTGNALIEFRRCGAVASASPVPIEATKDEVEHCIVQLDIPVDNPNHLAQSKPKEPTKKQKQPDTAENTKTRRKTWRKTFAIAKVPAEIVCHTQDPGKPALASLALGSPPLLMMKSSIVWILSTYFAGHFLTRHNFAHVIAPTHLHTCILPACVYIC